MFPQSSHVEALTWSVAVFGDRGPSKEVIGLIEVISVGLCSDRISILIKRETRELVL